MNLTSKRVTAALLTIAAFTGVLLKEIPFTSPEESKLNDTLAIDNTLGDVAVLSSVGEQLAPARPQAIPAQPEPVFSGMPEMAADSMGGFALSDSPSAGNRSGLPNPVGAPAGAFSTRGAAPFLPAGKSGLNSGGGVGGGGSGSGGGGSNSPEAGTPPANDGFIPGDGKSGESQENPPSDNGRPQLPQPPTNESGPSNPPQTGDDEVKSPPGNDNPANPFTPPWIDDPLPDVGGDTPHPDFPNPPSDGPTHSVPDSGSSAVFLAFALFGLLAASRKMVVR